MARPDLTVIEGGGDIVSLLEDVLAKAKAGTIDGIAFGFCTTNGHQFVGHAYRDDMPFAWARLQAVSDDLHARLLKGL